MRRDSETEDMPVVVVSAPYSKGSIDFAIKRFRRKCQLARVSTKRREKWGE